MKAITIACVIVAAVAYMYWLAPKILDYISRQFTEALPDDEQIEKQLDLDN